MKVSISVDEWYPIYTLSRHVEYYNSNIEIPEELYERYIRIMNDFEDLQEDLGDYYAGTNKDIK